MLYELHFGRHPFESTTKEEVARKIMSDEVEFPEPWQKGRDTDFKNFKKMIKRLLIKDPKVNFT